MSEYFSLFFESSRQITSLLAVAGVWLALAALGTTVSRAQDDRVLFPLLGWGLVTAVYTLLGTLTEIAFTWIALGSGIAAVTMAAVTLRRDKGGLLDPVYLRALIWAAPLLLLVSAMIGSQWDEFSHWLTGTKYLLHTDMYPGSGRPVSAASYPAYPYAWQLLGYFAGRLNGAIVENAGALLNILLLLTLGRIAVGKAASIAGKVQALDAAPWTAAALTVFSVSALNPTFVQKVILTAYADAATSVTLAVAIAIGWSILDALAEGDVRRARKRAFMAGLVFAVLVSLKQSTLELFGLGLGALFLAGLLYRNVRLPQLLACLVLAALPGVTVYAIWRHYVATQLQGQEFVIRPFAEWAFELLPTILYKIGAVLLKKSYFLAAMMLAVIVGVRGLFCGQTPYNRAMLTIGAVFLGHTAFLIFCYLAVFRGSEAENIASYWRYNQQLGGLAILSIVMSGGEIMRRHASALPLTKFKWVMIALIVAAPMLFAQKLRFDVEPQYHQYRKVGRAVAALIEPGAAVGVLDPEGSGESGIMVRYEVSDLTQNVWYRAAYHDMSVEGLSDLWRNLGDAYLVVNSVTPNVQAAIDPGLTSGNSYLLKRRPDGTAETLGVWPWPEMAR